MARTPRRLAATLCAAGLCAGLVAGCGGDEATTTVTVSSTAPATTTGGPAPAPEPLTLAQRVPTAEEFALFPISATQPTSLEDFVAAVGESDRDDDRAALEAAGFRRSVVQAYEAGDDGFAIAWVVEVDEAGAPGLVEHVASSLAAEDDPDVG